MKLLLVLCVSVLAVNATSDADRWNEFKVGIKIVC